jgi:trigger factor
MPSIDHENIIKNLKISHDEILQISDNDLENEINKLIKNDIMLEDKENDNAEKNDIVIIDFEGFDENEVPFEGGQAEKYELELGSNTFVPGFEEQLVGMKKKERKTIVVKFPSDYHKKDLANKNVTFKIFLHNIKKQIKPDLNDDYIRNLSIPNVITKNDLLSHFKKKIADDKKHEIRKKHIENLSNQIIHHTKDVNIPKNMIDNETKRLKDDDHKLLESYQISLADYLKQYLGISIDEYNEEIKKRAINNIKLSLTIDKLLKHFKIEFYDHDLNEYVEKNSLSYNLTENELREKLLKLSDGQRKYLILKDKLFDYLINNH